MCFNDAARTEIYTLSLHDALPILLLFFLLQRVQIVVLGVGPAVDGVNGTLVFSPLGGLLVLGAVLAGAGWFASGAGRTLDRKSTRLNSSHANIPYAVFCLKK